jgi:hypothetical protein
MNMTWTKRIRRQTVHELTNDKGVVVACIYAEYGQRYGYWASPPSGGLRYSCGTCTLKDARKRVQQIVEGR